MSCCSGRSCYEGSLGGESPYNYAIQAPDLKLLGVDDLN